MKKTTRLLAWLLCVVSLVSVFAFPASAKKVEKYNCAGTKGGGVSRYFYVETGKTKSSRQIKLTMDRGYIQARDNGTYKSSMVQVYGAYEIKVFYKNSEGRWVLEQDYDVYNKGSATITCEKKNTTYKVQVYSWRVGTVFASYHKNNVSARTVYGSVKFSKFFKNKANKSRAICCYSVPG